MMMFILLALTSCAGTTKGFELPPRPERKELPPPESLKDLANALNYYEFLLEDWEAWYETVILIINGQD